MSDMHPVVPGMTMTSVTRANMRKFLDGVELPAAALKALVRKGAVVERDGKLVGNPDVVRVFEERWP